MTDTPDQFEETPLSERAGRHHAPQAGARRRAAARCPVSPAIFTVANQKGGVGKTTTTVNLAAALARAGARVLVVRSRSAGQRIDSGGRRAPLRDPERVRRDHQRRADRGCRAEESRSSKRCTACPRPSIWPALRSNWCRWWRASSVCGRRSTPSSTRPTEPYHYVFIDCPPSLGLLTINAFVAATEVLIPIQCEYYALEGLSQLLNNIQLIERHLNPNLSVSTILLTMYDGRTNLAAPGRAGRARALPGAGAADAHPPVRADLARHPAMVRA